jgi:hypothetical protein
MDLILIAELAVRIVFIPIEEMEAGGKPKIISYLRGELG